MDEQMFLTVADAQLGRIETALERLIDAGEADIDVELKAGGVMELECSNGSKIIINRHSAAREIWIAARSGGYHFAFDGGAWVAAKDGSELMKVLARCLSEQTGAVIALDHTN
ncbi:MAG: iron donor protein CyaY [Rhodocyclaceae bacterium]|nr:iron donor protein CyaY [Rhodocyclaceae bacterium]